MPADRAVGAQTQRAVENFPISGLRIERALIGALASIKGAAVDRQPGARRVCRRTWPSPSTTPPPRWPGQWDDHFPVDVFQTGSGTSTNMNMNEVLANLATERLGRPVHPNDEVNASQSSNDVFPSAIHLAAVRETTVELLPALDHLVAVLREQARAPAEVVKAGRTHLMDATPVTLGQEFGGYAAQVAAAGGADEAHAAAAWGSCRSAARPWARASTRRPASAPRWSRGWPRHGSAAVRGPRPLRRPGRPRRARRALGRPAHPRRGADQDRQRPALDGIGSADRAGRDPSARPAAGHRSIMPGKVNPVIPEAVTQVCAQVIGNDAAVAFAGIQGNFELNVYLPVIARNLLESIRLLASVVALFADRCIAGIEADVERCRDLRRGHPAGRDRAQPGPRLRARRGAGQGVGQDRARASAPSCWSTASCRRTSSTTSSTSSAHPRRLPER